MSKSAEPARPRRRTQAERRAETRAAVLAAARLVFARRGLPAASLEEIAEEAGVSRGAVYYNFTDKEQLFLALLRERCRERAQQLQRLTDDSHHDLRAAATGFVRDAERDSDWTRLFYEFTALAVERPELRAELADELEDCRNAIARLLERRLGARGITSTLPIDHLAAVTSALANGLTLERLADPTLPPELLPQVIELIIAGLQAAAPPGER